ncbi:ABC-type bacteriocin/lantibiotic exporter with double-glycine peptidase domain [Kitasatospora sp. MAP12-15]|uniref:ABC transporter ATP-binding protein n=1 Tax=unclassified Kitasatospora TaxID=2633591 RepID=UPI0024749995|nr:ABC transporter ATP-binding protein [Kitasatospora sp. MAP12-44]MDH6115323.1 ABC-type bacteriocin/lantibiotic exporter with double-glycine peptidase domain [Kitasatospora sp. MAP12-44]
MKELWRTLHGHRTRFVVIMVAEAVSGGIEALVHPLLLKALFDTAILAGNFRRFLALGAGYLLLGLTLNYGGYWIACWRKRFENSLVLLLEMELLDRTLALDGRKVSEAGNASYVSRVHNDVYEGVLPAVDICIRIAKQALASAVFLGVLLYLSWQASFILLVIIPPLVVVSNAIGKRIEDNTERERDAEAGYINKLTRTLDAFHALRGLPSLLPGTRTANKDGLSRYLGITFTNYRLAQKQSTLSDLVMNLSDTASMVTGAYFVFAGRMTFGGFLAFVNSLWRAVTGIFDLVNMIPQARRSTAVLKRIHTLRDSQATAYHDEGPAVLVHGARVGYGDGVNISIDDFELRAGEHVLLRGPNGCGKTTLLHIISGTLAPDTGLVALPPRVASLTAPVSLPPLPVRELVADERLRTSMGLNALADQLPSELSSGQRQRVGVAALLCEDADLYLVDEPFANLDENGRDLVLRTLKEQTGGRGLLVVHHGDEDLDSSFDRVVTLSGTAVRP